MDALVVDNSVVMSWCFKDETNEYADTVLDKLSEFRAIVPSIWPEPLPYVVSEALLSERLVIASRIGGIPEQVKGSEGAFLFQPGNHEQLAELLQQVRGLKKEERLELGCQSKNSFLNKFNNERTSRLFLKTLEKRL